MQKLVRNICFTCAKNWQMPPTIPIFTGIREVNPVKEAIAPITFLQKNCDERKRIVMHS